MIRKWSLIVTSLLLLAGCGTPLKQAEPETYVTTENSGSLFVLAENGTPCPILCSQADHQGVLLAVQDLQSDFYKVTGNVPGLLLDPERWDDSTGAVIMVGTIGMSPLIDELIRLGKLDVSEIRGKWESSLTTVVKDPLPGIGEALVIAGSDKRGSIFGIYELSGQIGVSPWYYWADVTPARRESLYLVPGRYILGEPAVKYRGIFINDEAPALSGWVFENFGGFNHQFYEHVFELILRMKGNYLWPAMWGRAFYDDDPENAVLADQYGVVIGTTHHEPLMRAHVEWARYGSGPWDYRKNGETLRTFWKEGIERMGDHESIVSLGMRGDGDEPMTEGTAIALLEQIVDDQRKIIRETTGKPAEETPQLWALYKEVQDYYDRGMRVPGDVTLLLCDDNWGNIRKLPQPGEPERAGGYGIYYHFDYVGGPRNYKWLNTNQIERVWEQMHLAHAFGANQIWIVNVGDIKPMELPTQFFLDYAWDPGKWNPENLEDYYVEWSARQFGKTFAGPVADILSGYTRFNARRKPELLAPETYSLTHHREAERVVAAYRELEELAGFIYTDIPEELKDAYFQLVLFPVKACANLNELYVSAALNHLYAAQKRSATNLMAGRVRELYRADSLLTEQYHKELAGGKWNHMMSQTHIGYTYWQQPEQNKMPEVVEISVPETASMGVAIENSDQVWPGSDRKPVLPVFDALNRQQYYMEIFNRGSLAFNCTLTPSEPWIYSSDSSLTIQMQERVYLAINWSEVPEGRHSAMVEIKGAGNGTVPVYVEVDNRKTGLPLAGKEPFADNNGVVSMEAEHFSKAVQDEHIRWHVVPNLGRTGSSVITLPVTAGPSRPGGNSPRIEYEFYTRDTGLFVVQAYLSPTLNFHNTEGIRYAVSIDQEVPVIVNMHQQGRESWDLWVANNINIPTTVHHIAGPGFHTLKWWRVDAGTVLQKIVIRRNDTADPSYLGPPEGIRIIP
jgi:hypothetical protein